KAVIGDAYKAVEARLMAAIHLRFGLPATPTAELLATIKRADRAAAYLEATRLAAFSAAEAARFFGPPPKFSALIHPPYPHPSPRRRGRGALSGALRDADARVTSFRRHCQNEISTPFSKRSNPLYPEQFRFEPTP